jgi:hypothetical protein
MADLQGNRAISSPHPHPILTCLNVMLFGAKVPHVLVIGGRREFAHKRFAVLDLGRRLELGLVDLR